MVPGLPTLPFILFAAVMFLAAGAVADRDRNAGDGKAPGKDAPGKDEARTPEEVQNLLPLDQLELEVGYGLIPLVDEEQNGNLLSRIRSIRRQFALDMGVVIPSLHLRDNLQLRPGQYVLLIKGNQVASAEILIDHYLAMDPGNASRKIEGVDTREPAFNLPALWIPAARREDAMMAGYTVVDPATVIATHLTEVLRRHLADFLGRQEVQALLDVLGKSSPKAVEELVPGTLSLGVVQKVLQNLVRENVSIRDMLTIAETLGDHGSGNKNPDLLTEFVRERLSRTIVRQFVDRDGVLPVITMNQQTEKTLQDGMRQAEGSVYLSLHPSAAQKLIHNINTAVEGAVGASGGQPVLLAAPVLRAQLAQLITRFLPGVPVISQAEIPPDMHVQAVGTVGID
jgi:flagellar biosynthesis protein FlhA